MRHAFRLLLPLLALAACSPSTAATGDSAATAKPVDRAAEEQAIRDLDAKWVRMVAAKDTAGIADLYSSDALFMPPNSQALGGRPGVVKGWNGMLSAPGAQLTFKPTKIVVAEAGDIAYDIGTYTFGVEGPKGRTEDRGKYLVVWKKQDGAWKVAADMFNSDLAAK
jgi:uncharacterized protein (TIGR02246 family)